MDVHCVYSRSNTTDIGVILPQRSRDVDVNKIEEDVA